MRCWRISLFSQKWTRVRTKKCRLVWSFPYTDVFSESLVIFYIFYCLLAILSSEENPSTSETWSYLATYHPSVYLTLGTSRTQECEYSYHYDTSRSLTHYSSSIRGIWGEWNTKKANNQPMDRTRNEYLWENFESRKIPTCHNTLETSQGCWHTYSPFRFYEAILPIHMKKRSTRLSSYAISLATYFFANISKY